MEQIVFNDTIILEKFPSKGGWTYVKLPGLLSDGNWQKLRGTIDGYEVPVFGIMPFGNGVRFAPVRAEIRKAIGKEAGEMVSICLYQEAVPEINIRGEFLQCLEDDPSAWKNFHTWSKDEQEREMTWIEGGSSLDAKIERMADAVKRIGENWKKH